jgi:hypothetical protein
LEGEKKEDTVTNNFTPIFSLFHKSKQTIGEEAVDEDAIFDFGNGEALEPFGLINLDIQHLELERERVNRQVVLARMRLQRARQEALTSQKKLAKKLCKKREEENTPKTLNLRKEEAREPE